MPDELKQRAEKSLEVIRDIKKKALKGAELGKWTEFERCEAFVRFILTGEPFEIKELTREEYQASQS